MAKRASPGVAAQTKQLQPRQPTRRQLVLVAALRYATWSEEAIPPLTMPNTISGVGMPKAFDPFPQSYRPKSGRIRASGSRLWSWL